MAKINGEKLKWWVWGGILGVGLLVRFWGFPGNVYFGYDQSRDAFLARGIYEAGDIKIVGPTTSWEGLWHGVAYWYLVGPVYLIFGGDPVGVGAFLRILNLLSLLLVFLIGRRLFDEKVGLMAAVIYAVSFENWQSALYFGNPGPAAVTTLVFYWGLVELVKEKRSGWGWVLLGLGLGLSVQMQFYLVHLFFVGAVMMVMFRKRIFRELNFRGMVIGVGVLIVTLSTFLISELKFPWRQTRVLWELVRSGGKGDVSGGEKLVAWLLRLQTLMIDTLGLPDRAFGFLPIGVGTAVAAAILGGVGFWAFGQRKGWQEGWKFLGGWVILSGGLFLLGTHSFYYMVGVSGALAIFGGAVVAILWERRRWWGTVVLGLVLVGNGVKIVEQAPKGPRYQVYVQEGMLYPLERQVVDWVYSRAKEGEAVVEALTMPYDVYTTWAYWFLWYGQGKYGWVPDWARDEVVGFPGELPTVDKLICDKFVIYEPTRGIEQLVGGFAAEQEITSELVEEAKFGGFVVQKRRDRACK